MLTTALAAGIALAAPWTPSEPVDLEFDSSAHSVAVMGRWGGSDRIVLGDPDGLTIRNADGTDPIAFPMPIADLQLVDLDSDGVLELITCGSTGVHVLRGRPTALDDVVLTDGRCEQLAVGRKGSIPVLLMRNQGRVAELVPAKGGLSVQPIPDLDGIRDIAMNGIAMAALGDQLYLRGSGGIQTLPVPEGTVGVDADAGGWALAVAGASPRLVRSNGVEVPLPYAPTGISRVVLGTPQFLVPLDGPAYVGGYSPIIVRGIPEGSRPFAVGDIDADGCADLLLQGTVTRLQRGQCESAAPGKAVAAMRTPLTGDFDLGADWGILEVDVGSSAELQLVDTVGQATTFQLTSGPSGMTLGSSGLLSYRPLAGDVGLWRAAIVAGDRHTGLVVKVVGANEPAVAQDLPVRTEVDPQFRNNVRDSGGRKGFFAFRTCTIGAGAAVGASQNARSTWSNVGLPNVVPSGSPAIVLGCSGGSKTVRWLFGVDSAPTFSYLAPGGRMNHILAGTFGVEIHTPVFRVGPFVDAGLLIFGAGLRTQLMPFQTRKGARHGIELRAQTFPAILSIQGLLAYSVEFGRF